MPLGQLTLTLQSPGNTSRRVTSKDFQLYEDKIQSKEGHGVRDLPRARTKNNNKENLPPFAKGTEQGINEQDLFVRQVPRGGPLTKLKRSDKPDERVSALTLEVETNLESEEEVTSCDFAGGEIVHGTKRKVSSRSKGPVKSQNYDHTRLNYGEEGQLFEIHQDDIEGLEMEHEANADYQNVSDDDDKENVKPTLVSLRLQFVDNRLDRTMRKASTSGIK